jgi:hypothetical protein
VLAPFLLANRLNFSAVLRRSRVAGTIHSRGTIMPKNKRNNEKTSLIDLSDEELLAAYRNSIQNASWTPANYRKEMFWRSQERNTNAYNRWTSIIALATLINTLAIIVQLLKGLNVL